MPVREMGLKDVGFAVDMIGGEGWGHTRVDLERMLTLSPGGSVLWESGGVPRGFITSVRYGSTAMIGHLLVSKRCRGRSIGRTLLERLLDDLDSSGVRSIILFATEEGGRLYSQYGFAKSHGMTAVGLYVSDSVRRGMTMSCERVSQDDIGAVCALDRSLFGDDRTALLSRLHADFPEHCFRIGSGSALTGFAFGRRTPIGFDIGPWVCTSGSREDAASLLDSVMRSFPCGGRMDLSPFADNRDALDILRGFRRYRKAETVSMMVRGEGRYPSGRGKVLSVAGFEMG